MKGIADIQAGVCGFHTIASVSSEDGQHVVFEVSSDCAKIQKVAAALNERGRLDAYEEIRLGDRGVLMQAVHAALTGCCAGCAVPAGMFKAMQVAAGLALPRDIDIRLTAEQS